MKNNQLEYFAIIWGAMVTLSVTSMLFVRENAVFITITASIVALLATVAIAAASSTTAGNAAKGVTETLEKAKNSPASRESDTLLRLLDEDDLEDLRRRVKRRLIDQIEGSGDGELSSLDVLLSEQQGKRR